MPILDMSSFMVDCIVSAHCMVSKPVVYDSVPLAHTHTHNILSNCVIYHH